MEWLGNEKKDHLIETYLYNKLKGSKIRVQSSWSIRLDHFLASSILSSGTIGDKHSKIKGNSKLTAVPCKPTFKSGNKEPNPAAYMLSDWKTQCRSRCWKRKLELGNIMTQLPLLNKFKLLEILGVQAAYRTDHSTTNTNELQGEKWD